MKQCQVNATRVVRRFGGSTFDRYRQLRQYAISKGTLLEHTSYCFSTAPLLLAFVNLVVYLLVTEPRSVDVKSGASNHV